MGRLLRRWADQRTREENARLRAERRNLRRIVRELRNAHRTLEHVAAMRSAHIGRLQMQLAEAAAETDEIAAELAIERTEAQQGDTK